MGPGERDDGEGQDGRATRPTTTAPTVRVRRLAVPVPSGHQDGPHSADAVGFARLTNMILGILTAGIRELRKFWFIELPLTILPELTLAYSFLTRL